METTDKIKNITGTHVTGKDFFGRTKEVQDAWNMIEEGNSLKLDAPRRVGKSSFAYKMIEKAEIQEWKCAYWDLQGCQNEDVLYSRLIAELEKKNQKSTTNKWNLEGIELEPQVLGNKFFKLKWGRKKNLTVSQSNNIYSILEKIFDHTKDTLIVIDEITVYLNHLEKKGQLADAINFLHWLSSQRKKDSKIRWILCSSISIDNFVDEHEISKVMRSLETFSIDQLKGNEPLLLIEALAKSTGLNFSDEAKQCMLNKISWHLPFYIQLLFKAVKGLKEINVSAATIEKAYQNLLDIEKKGDYFKTLIQDLKNYKDKKDIAKLLLDGISKPANGCSENILKLSVVNEIKDEKKAKNILDDLLEKLINDGYIMFNKETKKYLFRSPFVRDLWVNKFIK